MEKYRGEVTPDMPMTPEDVLRINAMLGTTPPENFRRPREFYGGTGESAALMSHPSSMAPKPYETGVFDFRLEGDMPIVHATGSRGERAFAAWVNNHAGKFPPADMTPPAEERPTERSGEALVPPQESPMHVRVRETDEWALKAEAHEKAAEIVSMEESGSSRDEIGAKFLALTPQMRELVMPILQRYEEAKSQAALPANDAPFPDKIFKGDTRDKATTATGSQQAVEAEKSSSGARVEKSVVLRHRFRSILGVSATLAAVAGGLQVATMAGINSYCGEPAKYAAHTMTCTALKGSQVLERKIDTFAYDQTIARIVSKGGGKNG